MNKHQEDCKNFLNYIEYTIPNQKLNLGDEFYRKICAYLKKEYDANHPETLIWVKVFYTKTKTKTKGKNRLNSKTKNFLANIPTFLYEFIKCEVESNNNSLSFKDIETTLKGEPITYDDYGNLQITVEHFQNFCSF